LQFKLAVKLFPFKFNALVGNIFLQCGGAVGSASL
jgi:hypothetical protein